MLAPTRMNAVTQTSMNAPASFLGKSKQFVTDTYEKVKPYNYSIIVVVILALIIGVVVIVVDAFYPFIPVNPFGGISSDARQYQKTWPSSGQDLTYVANPPIPSDSYSVSIQFAISDSRNNPDKYKHIFHRGSALLPDVSLPATMNPGVFLNRNTNDVCVYVTSNKLDTCVIQDLPLGTTINLSIVCNKTIFEVYVNCKLYTTLFLHQPPVMPATDTTWYGRSGTYRLNGAIQNLRIWGTPITPYDVKTLCQSSAISNIPDTCSTYSPSLPSLPAAQLASVAPSSFTIPLFDTSIVYSPGSYVKKSDGRYYVLFDTSGTWVNIDRVPDYNEKNIYRTNHVVLYDYKIYMAKNDIGVPGINPIDTTYWIQLSTILYKPSVAYALNQYVFTENGNIYRSIQNTNTTLPPSTKWDKVKDLKFIDQR